MSDTFKSNFKVQDKQMMSLSVYNVGFQKCTPGYQWGPGVRDHYLIHHIVSGKGLYEVNGKTYELAAGDSFLVYPFVPVVYRAGQDDPWEYYWVGFSGTDASTILRSTDFSRETPLIHQAGYSDQIKRQILHIYDARGNDLEHSVEMTGRLYTTLALFIKYRSRQEARKDSYQTYVEKAISYIASHYSYPISIEELASYVGISRSHLFRAFQTQLSVSPKEYLSQYRIRQACSLLAHSDLSVTAIARSVGFENSLYFSRVFHKIKGLSPTDYARSQTDVIKEESCQ